MAIPCPRTNVRQPPGPDPKKLPALLTEALDEPVMATIDWRAPRDHQA
jgi:hypothetical protein